ncbi:MAG: hypothetical protein D6812_12700 [Deltaproteobacteria bacterium]|nr:MAG: hypothetical protein D6812_12700 [Deltaproteobacteria bacterium]
MNITGAYPPPLSSMSAIPIRSCGIFRHFPLRQGGRSSGSLDHRTPPKAGTKIADASFDVKASGCYEWEPMSDLPLFS